MIKKVGRFTYEIALLCLFISALVRPPPTLDIYTRLALSRDQSLGAGPGRSVRRMMWFETGLIKRAAVVTATSFSNQF